jgi:hypothetical protein
MIASRGSESESRNSLHLSPFYSRIAMLPLLFSHKTLENFYRIGAFRFQPFRTPFRCPTNLRNQKVLHIRKFSSVRSLRLSVRRCVRLGIHRIICPFFIFVFDGQLLQGDELRDLIQGFLAQMESGELVPDSRLDFHTDIERGEFAWLKALRYCPRGLLDLVNSKACRGIR